MIWDLYLLYKFYFNIAYFILLVRAKTLRSFCFYIHNCWCVPISY